MTDDVQRRTRMGKKRASGGSIALANLWISWSWKGPMVALGKPCFEKVCFEKVWFKKVYYEKVMSKYAQSRRAVNDYAQLPGSFLYILLYHYLLDLTSGRRTICM